MLLSTIEIASPAVETTSPLFRIHPHTLPHFLLHTQLWEHLMHATVAHHGHVCLEMQAFLSLPVVLVGAVAAALGLN